MNDDIEALKGKLAEIEAQATVMRRALRDALHDFTCPQHEQYHSTVPRIRHALRAEAGKDALVELQTWRSLCPEIQQFALAMEGKIQAHQTKHVGCPGWKHLTPGQIYLELQAEEAELDVEADKRDWTAAGKEAVDVANFCMFLWDVTREVTPC